MAIWQYDIALVPRTGVICEDGIIPDELPGYRAVSNPGDQVEQKTRPAPEDLKHSKARYRASRERRGGNRCVPSAWVGYAAMVGRRRQ